MIEAYPLQETIERMSGCLESGCAIASRMYIRLVQESVWIGAIMVGNINEDPGQGTGEIVRSEQPNLAYWRGTVDVSLREITRSVQLLVSRFDESNRRMEIVVQNNSQRLEVHQSLLSEHTGAIKVMADDMASLAAQLADLSNQVENMKSLAARRSIQDQKQVEELTSKAGENVVTWAYIRDKIALPLLVGFLTFFFFTILPVLIVVIYLVTKSIP